MRRLSPIERIYIGAALRAASGPYYLVDAALDRARLHRYWPKPHQMNTGLQAYVVDLGHRNGAIAVTIGDDIYFDPERLDVNNIPLRLIAHEVTHVLQEMREGGFENYATQYLPSMLVNGHGADPFEIEAEEVARATDRLLWMR